MIKVFSEETNDCTIEEESEESWTMIESIWSIASFISENWADAVHPGDDLFFLFKYLDRLLWSADNVEVKEANWVCKDARAVLVDSLMSGDSNSELRELDIWVTSDIVLDTAEDKAEND